MAIGYLPGEISAVNNSAQTNSRRNQAFSLFRNNRLAEAKDAFEQLCQVNKTDVEAWICLAQINAQLGQPREVERCCREVIALWPESDDAHYHLGCALLLQGKHEETAEQFRHVLKLKPRHALAHLHLGKALHMQEKYDEALIHYRNAVALDPKLTDVQGLIGGIHQRRANIADAIACYRETLRHHPHDHNTHSDMLLALNYGTNANENAMYAEHVAWGRAHKLKTARTSAYANAPDPDKRLRVGYVSPDFRQHSVAFFFEPLLTHHDPARIETFCYADVAQPDATTERLRSLTGQWRNTTGVSDDRLAEQVRADGIDILVDLAGHTVGNRLLVFTAKSAPVQVTYLGYPNTTGIEAMDYRLTDAYADPPGVTDNNYSETLFRLPRGFLCYRPPDDAPSVKSLPALASGRITFGSFNNLMKVTPEVISVWASILKAVPNSRLIMKNNSFGDASTRERCLDMFMAHSISRERLEFLPPAGSLPEHLDLYGRVDIALDTFPYNGTTTTCEALWMGVPVITLAGRRHASRVGVSLLTQAGLADFIATSPDEYVRIACSLASQSEALSRLRATLRGMVVASPLCDEKSFARDIEAAYREMWIKWCAQPSSATL